MQQRIYIKELLIKFKQKDCLPFKKQKPIENLSLRKRKYNETSKRSVIGNLISIAVCTRPDIMFALSRAARKNKNPTLEEWANVERILKYLSYTIY